MKEQTFIVELKDKNNSTIDFERFSYKRLNTCINAMIKLYKKAFDPYCFCGFLYKENVEKAARIVAYRTDYKTNDANKVWDISIDEFIKMLKTELREIA